MQFTGISRDSRHKRRATGGKKANLKKKRLYESGRPPAMTKIGATRVHTMRVRGGNEKFRALRLDTGNFSWGSEGNNYFHQSYTFSLEKFIDSCAYLCIFSSL
jgi:ribosomal protein eS8